MVFRFAFLMSVAVFFSCSEKRKQSNESSDLIDSPRTTEEFLSSVPNQLELDDYLLFLKGLHKLTYDISESDQHLLSVLYKPQSVEAALSVQGLFSESQYLEVLQQKDAYHYALIGYEDKIPSVTGARESTSNTLSRICQELIVVKNQSDTLRPVITEIIPAMVMGQPDQIVVLIPKDASDQRVYLKADAGYSDLTPVSIDLDMTLLRRFPKLKI